MKSFGLCTASHNRPKVLSLFGACITRLRKELNMFIPVVVVTDKSNKAICDKYHLFYIEQENIPVSERFNRGMAYLKGIGVEYAIITGDDDIWSTDTLRAYFLPMETGYDLIGIQEIYFYALEGIYRGQLCKLETKKILGVGKCISASVLDKIDWRPWTKDKNWGLDALVSMAIAPHVRSQFVIPNPMICDCKSKKNMNGYTLWAKKFKALDPQKLYSCLSEEEMEIIKSF